MSLMLQTFADVLTPAEHESLLAIADRTTFVSGLETASRRLADTKQNEQMMLADPANAEVSKIVGTAISRHSAFRTATMPRQVHSLRLSRYRAGMRYGKHVDAPLMQDGPLALRADLSFTLFLSDPKDYQGGELCLETGSGDARLKLPARHMVVYPTGQLHEVREVTAGSAGRGPRLDSELRPRARCARDAVGPERRHGAGARRRGQEPRVRPADEEPRQSGAPLGRDLSGAVDISS